MQFILTPSALLNAAGAFLFVVAGIVILALARGRRRGILIGGNAATFGLTYVVQNLVGWGDGAADGPILLLVFAAAAAFFHLLLAIDLAAGLPFGKRRALAVISLLGGLVFASLLAVFQFSEITAIFATAGVPFSGVTRWALNANSAQQIALIVLMAAVALRFSDVASNDAQERRGLACLGLSFGTFIMYLMAGPPSAQVALLQHGLAWDLVYGRLLVLGILATVAMVPFSAGLLVPGDGLSRAVFPAILASGAAGIALTVASWPTFVEDFGSYGIVRTIGVVFLVLGVVKFDLLGVPLPNLVAKRGLIAGGALAILFVVAQVAQNFFSAQYGLLGGGIIAGTFLFAASPVQRAIESRHGGKPSVNAPGAGNDDSFRDAVELAFKDRRFTAKEELALARLATRLGVSAERATEIRHAVEGAR